MDNALENNNLEEGQVNDNVGQDEATQQQESKNDWESQAKYFQSEKDKLHAENQKLKQYEQIDTFGNQEQKLRAALVVERDKTRST